MSNAKPDLFFVPGNHLYPLKHLRPFRDLPILMVEDSTICERRAYHQQKLGLIIAAMREYAEQLRSGGYDVRYLTLQEGRTIPSALAELVVSLGARSIATFEISDNHLSNLLSRCVAERGIEWQVVGDPGFLTSSEDFASYAAGKKQLRMGNFYSRQRKILGVMVDAQGKPAGGRWSFDADNRKRLPRTQNPPLIPEPKHSAVTQAALVEVGNRFSQHPGSAGELWLPTTRRAALGWLQNFIDERLVGFGTYEDAISQRSPTLFHSTLSPLINLGLLTPDEVIERVLQSAEMRSIPLNDLEGFLRQVIGWREFIRGTYNQHGDLMRRNNARVQTRQLAACWFDGTTGIPPLDQAIHTHRQLGWNHHIERLMVIANLMNLCEIQPEAVYEYFMCHYIDAYDWVMVPNVYGMGLNSDGGIFATKPYIAGSNYLLKMSDFKPGDWCDVVDGLYWRFVANNREELQRNPRLAIMPRGLDRLKPERRDHIFAAAEAFLDRATG